MKPYALVLEEMYPGTEWSVSDGDYDSLVWMSDAPKPTREELEAQINQAVASRKARRAREMRDYLLATQVDPIVMNPLRWAELSEEKRSEWTQYRRDLLDLPQQSGFPGSIAWPAPPA